MPGIKRKEPSSQTLAPEPKAIVKKFKTESKADHKPKDTAKQASKPPYKKDYQKDHSKQHYQKDYPKPTAQKETSRETHAKQRTLARERKAAKPNADSLARSKKLWEQLRRKSHVAKEERDTLVAELFDIVLGNVKEFVFKHDSVRVVQCAIKYASLEQKKEIAMELKGQYTALAESRYAKFLVAKLLVEDKDIREMIVSEFYGHVKRLINHPEASWILDDTYRGVATAEQKAVLLREWYGPEFAIFKTDADQTAGETITADLPIILAANPEKRKPIMNHLFNLINQLVQKKLTGFTMLHDAMLQYSLADGGSGESQTLSTEFLDLIKPTEESDEDLLKNLAFTPSGSRLVCRVLALTAAKDRKQVLRAYKDSVPLLARDPNGVRILIAACEVVDDTVLTSKLIFPPLIPPTTTAEEQRYNTLEELLYDPIGRIALLYSFTSATAAPKKNGTSEQERAINPNRTTANWLIPPTSPLQPIITELRALRTTTSKKDPATRRTELQTALLKQSSYALLSIVPSRIASLSTTPFGCQFLTEVLLTAPALLRDDSAATEHVDTAMAAVADLTHGDPSEATHVAQVPAAGRMLKTLAQGTPLGGAVDSDTETQSKQYASTLFAPLLWERIAPHIVAWATGPSSFVAANLLENNGFIHREAAKKALSTGKARKELQRAAGTGNQGAELCLGMLS